MSPSSPPFFLYPCQSGRRDKIEKKKNCFAAKIEKKPDWTFTRFGMSALVKVIASAAIAKRGLFRYQRVEDVTFLSLSF